MKLTRGQGVRRAGIGAIALFTMIIGLLQPSPAAAAEPPPDGLSAATAAGSCWEIKQTRPSAPSGIYWLVTPALIAPQEFYCDQETAGGGWVLVGRGREAWKEGYNGLRTPEQVRNTPSGTGAFAPAQLPADTVDGLLNGGRVDALQDSIRLRRATNQAGTSWQETRFNFVKRDRWVWSFGAEHRVGGYSFDSASGSGGQTNNFGRDNRFQRVVFSEQSTHNYLNGFAFGSLTGGSTAATSYLWAPSGQGYARPFTQMFLRPRLTIASMNFGTIPAGGAPAMELPEIPSSDALQTVWGVSGFANGNSGELNTEVAEFGEIDGKVYVGGNFRYVQRSEAGADRVEQRYLAAFNVASGEWVSGFRPQLNGQVKAIQPLPDGRLAIAGQFSQVNGVNQTGIAILDPDSGQLTGWQVAAEQRTTGGVPYVRDLDVQGSYLYVAGALTHLVRVGGSTSGSSWNGGRINLSSGQPDTNWNANLNGTSVAVDASAEGDRAYFSGYFKMKGTTSTPSGVAIQSAAGASLVQPLWRPTFSKSSVDGNGNITGNVWQLGVTEAGGKVWLGGSEHSLFAYDRDTFALVSGSITKAGGDFQTVEHDDNLVYGGCHCGHWVYQDSYTWSDVGTNWDQGDKINLMGAWDAETGDYVEEWSPVVQARAGYGAWGMFADSRGVLWAGGDFSRSVRAGGASQWSGGYIRFAARDAEAPTKPGAITVSAAGGGEFDLNWGASTDSGGVTYEVLRENRVIASTTARTLTVPAPDGPTRYFVRARDAAGNRSATTAAATVEPPSDDQLLLVEPGADWSWRYSGDPLPSGWNGRTFDDSSWSEGPAVLAVGVPGAETNINAGNLSPRPLSAQFRTTFSVTDAETVVDGVVSVIANDGVVVYVNGTEIGRSRLPSGTISQNTYATGAPTHASAAASRVTFDVPYGLLVDGNNVIAASTHANYRSTPDLSFDLSFTAERGSAPAPPTAVTGLTAEASGPDSVTVSWSPPADGTTPPTSYAISRDGEPVGTTPASVQEFEDTGLDPETTYQYAVTAVGPGDLVSAPRTVSVTTPEVPDSPTVIANGATWAWKYDNTPWPAGWTEVAFDDSSWSEGPAVLGVGVTGQQTDLNGAGVTPRPLSAQLRHEFTLEDVDDLGDGTVTVIANDGVVVFLNGTELGRARMPAGTLSQGSYATGSTSHTSAAANRVTFEVPAELLSEGANVIAASVHANYRSTPDLSFDLELEIPR